MMKKCDGTLLTESKEISFKFKNMFEKLFRQPRYTIVEQLLNEQLKKGEETELDMLKNGKAP